MAESVCRTLRDGALEGEHAPALTIKDSVASPFGHHVFSYVLHQISAYVSAGKSQSRGLVLVAYSRSPSFYMDLLKRKGLDITSSHKWIQILDCYTDPLGWKDGFREAVSSVNIPQEASLSRICTNVRDMDKLTSSIIEMGKGLVGLGKVHFSVAIDSVISRTNTEDFVDLVLTPVSEMLRHSSSSLVARLLSNLRGHDQVSSIFWLLHADLHKEKVTAMLEYLSSMVASVEPPNQSVSGQRLNLDNSALEPNSRKGKFHARFKRRNGRVRVMIEDYHVHKSGIEFNSSSSDDATINQGILPKVHFNLQLSEKERIDRAKVVLPFEHQGNGEPIQIYDGRRSLAEGKNEETPLSTIPGEFNAEPGTGEIIYFRDSDGETLDSDEDPDDDLDI